MSSEAPHRRRLSLVLVALAFLMLLGLGTWQVYRYLYLSNLNDKLAAGLAEPPIALPTGPIDAQQLRFHRVRVEGIFLHDKEIHLLANTEEGEQGFQIITPLRRDDGSYVLINRGWVSNDFVHSETRPQGQVQGRVTIAGIARDPGPQGWFVPDNQPTQNLWFWRDLAGMAKQDGLTVAPVFVEADATPNPGGWPKGGQSVTRVRNASAEYAITWYLLAVALVVMYWSSQRTPNRPPDRSPNDPL